MECWLKIAAPWRLSALPPPQGQCWWFLVLNTCSAAGGAATGSAGVPQSASPIYNMLQEAEKRNKTLKVWLLGPEVELLHIPACPAHAQDRRHQTVWWWGQSVFKVCRVKGWSSEGAVRSQVLVLSSTVTTTIGKQISWRLPECRLRWMS